jgi:DamX protein
MAEQEKNQLTQLDLSAQAMVFLGLSQQPFSASILHGDTIYTDAILEQLIDTTKHHLQFSELLLIIEGDIGSGKTTLFRQLLQNKIDNLFLISVSAVATSTLAQIQQTISIHLKEQNNTDHLDDKLQHLQMFDQTPVLIIDDAHVLTDTTLQELLRYQKYLHTEKKVQLKILLLANKDMAATIEVISDIQHNQLYVQQLPAYTDRQTHALLLQRLSAAGYQGKDYFSSANLQQTNGTPLQIMLQAITLLEKAARKPARISFSRPRPAVLFAGLLIALFISGSGYYFLSAQAPVEPSVSTDKIMVEITPSIPASLVPIATETQLSDNDRRRVETPPITKVEVINADIEIKSTAAPQSENSSETKKITATNAARISHSATEVGHLETHNSASAALATDHASDHATSAAANTDESTNSREIDTSRLKKTPPTEASTGKIEALIKPTKTAALIDQTIEKPAQVKTEPLNTHLIQLKSLGLHDADWLKQQDANNWTLQIMAARDPARLLQFARQHKLSQTSAWFKTELSGKPWYVLVHRLYTDKDIARQSIQRLPSGLKNAKPWVKNIGIIQKSMRP